MHLTRNGWNMIPKDRTLFDTEDIAHNVCMAFKQTDKDDSHIYSYEKVHNFKYLKDYEVYTPGTHITQYMLPEVVQRFVVNFQKSVSQCERWYDIYWRLQNPDMNLAFVWADTPEGYEYWNAVDNELREMMQNRG